MNEDQTNEYIKNLINANNLISEDILNNDCFDVEDLELVRDRVASLMGQLDFWIKQDNSKRFCYDLKNHIQWMLDNYS
jgi:hypothetical protein